MNSRKTKYRTQLPSPMKVKAKFVGDENPVLKQAMKAEDEKAKKAKAGHWIPGRWEDQNGKLILIIPRFIEDLNP
jgi:hypothetical protein